MKSTSGVHFIGLDHIRAIAALLVFSWHFTHGPNGYPSPFEGTPAWGPLVLFDEGHVGVALFMTLSGYLFAKLLDGKQINYILFFWNRILRLFPLLIFVIIVKLIITAIDQDIRTAYWAFLVLPNGFILPSWPNGGWSVTTELHFYLLLPILLFIKRKGVGFLLLFILMATCYRAYFFLVHGEVQSIAYWTILGRIDQFIFGIIGFYLSSLLQKKHILALTVSIIFLSIYYYFDNIGGFYLNGGYPSSSSIWIFLPSIEGLAFSILIAWYDTSFKHNTSTFSLTISRVGEYSYSIYLTHFFFVFAAAKWIDLNIISLANFYTALFVSFLAFAAMIPIGYLSMRYIEKPFLKYRKAYY